MRELIAGEGGSVLVAGSTNPDAVALACEGLAETVTTPSGVPVYPTDALPERLDVGLMRIVACEHSTRAHLQAWAGQLGIATVDQRPSMHAKPDGARIVAVSAPSTGCGKTALTRRVARTLHRSGVGVAVLRHPIANLLLWGRFDPVIVRSASELTGDRPIEEREELAPVVGTGVSVVAGLDPVRLLRVAAEHAGPGGVVVWDGGGAAHPWVEADLRLVAVDLLRPPRSDEHIREADVVVLTKADSAPDARARDVEEQVRAWNGRAKIVLADLAVGVRPGNELTDRRVVVVEDANSLILGGLSAGAGAVAARRFRCGVVDPRPFAVGAIARALQEHKHIGAVIPSLGRTQAEIDDLAASVHATPGDAVLWASNADPSVAIGLQQRPVIRAFGELTEVAGPGLQEVLAPLLPGHA